jgi:hypothetical protein
LRQGSAGSCRGAVHQWRQSQADRASL